MAPRFAFFNKTWSNLRRVKRSRSMIACLLSIVAFTAIAEACSIPVFRYALEHWVADHYELHVLHSQPLSEDQKQRLAALKKSILIEPRVNLDVVVADISDEGSKEPLKWLLESNRSSIDDEAWFALLLPQRMWAMHAAAGGDRAKDSRVVWSAPFNRENVERLLDSPTRQTILKKLLAGDSVVWAYLDGGNTQQDEETFSMLESELERLEKLIKLPVIDLEDLTQLSADPKQLRVAFSAVRLSRNDPKEEVFVRMLLATEPDLRDASMAKSRMAFPIFGRGRALYALVDNGINAQLIEEACRFLTGACQCTVKAENPGSDLVFSAAWEELVTVTEPKSVTVSAPGLAGFGAPEARHLEDAGLLTQAGELKRTDELRTVQIDSKPSSSLLENAWIYVGLIAVAVTIAGMLVLRRI